ncbi:MAG: proton-conducting transporter membrane subunit [Nocardioides sp.]
MLVLIVAHAVAAVLAPVLVRWWGARAFWLLALVPAAAFAWLAWSVPGVLDGRPVVESLTWVPSLHLTLDVRIDPLSMLLALSVTGVGAVILLYSRWYFAHQRAGLERYALAFVAFAGSMLGLIVVDNMLVLYVFWELTTIFSYLLIAQHVDLRASRRAAMQALMVTTFGGLAMLVGIVALGTSTGSWTLSAVVAHPPTGPVATVAVIALLLGALSKSALVPLHFWLPAAMAAPTPVSAYLHAAAMVKAGLYLLARFAPAFGMLGVWRVPLVVLGGLGLLLGSWVALRQSDIKLLLAYGTVGQLGLIALLLGLGTPYAVAAALLVLTAHALYKSALFLVVGVVDHEYGTRDLTRLSGVGRAAPWLAGIAGLAAASMVGLPPLLGFVAKESAYGAVGAFATSVDGLGWVVLAVVLAGAALTVGYAGRFLWGAFAGKPGLDPPAAAGGSRAILAGPAALALAGLVGGIAAPAVGRLVLAYAHTVPAAGHAPAEPALWHGLSAELGLSVLGLALGVAGYLVLRRRGAPKPFLPEPWQAQQRYRRLMRGVDRLAVETTGVTQRGSVPFYLGTALVVLGLLLAISLARNGLSAQWYAWDTPAQLWITVLSTAVVVGAVLVRQRLAAVLLVGASGYAMVTIFVLHGAPDLALTQALVETCTLVVFVLVLRKLPKQITERDTRRGRLRRLAIAVPVGLLVAVGGAVALGARTSPAVSLDFPDLAYAFGGGTNVVNVILVDLRAWDTFGEISVLIAAATGVASMVFLRRRTGSPPQLDDSNRRDPLPSSRTFLRGGLAVPTGAALAHPGGRHPADLPDDDRAVGLPALRRPQRARRRFRRRARRRTGSGAALRRGRPVRARGGGAGRRRAGAGSRPAGRGRDRSRRADRRRPGPAEHHLERHPAGLRRGQAGDRALLRHRRLPGRRRTGPGHPAQPRRRDRRQGTERQASVKAAFHEGNPPSVGRGGDHPQLTLGLQEWHKRAARGRRDADSGIIPPPLSGIGRQDRHHRFPAAPRRFPDVLPLAADRGQPVRRQIPNIGPAPGMPVSGGHRRRPGRPFRLHAAADPRPGRRSRRIRPSIRCLDQDARAISRPSKALDRLPFQRDGKTL